MICEDTKINSIVMQSNEEETEGDEVIGGDELGGEGDAFESEGEKLASEGEEAPESDEQELE